MVLDYSRYTLCSAPNPVAFAVFLFFKYEAQFYLIHPLSMGEECNRTGHHS